MIRVTCSKCEKKLGVDDASAGTVIACPSCKTKLRVPSAPAKAAGAPKPRAGAPDKEAKANPNSPAKDPGVKAGAPLDGNTKRTTVPEDEDGTMPYTVESPPEPPKPKKRKKPKDGEEDVDFEEIGADSAYLKKRKRKKQQERAEQLIPGIGNVALTVCLLLFMWAILAAMSWFKPQALFIMVLFGWLVAMAASVWLLIVAFQESLMWGLLCLFVPFAALVFVAMYTERALKPFLLNLTGGAIIATGIFLPVLKPMIEARLSGTTSPAATSPAAE